MSKLFIIFVLYLLLFPSLHPERILLEAGSTQKSDLPGKIHGDGGRTGAIRLSITIARAGGGGGGGRPSGGGKSVISHTAAGGTPTTPVNSAGNAGTAGSGSGSNHQKDSHRSGAARGRWSCGGLSIMLITIIISLFIQM